MTRIGHRRRAWPVLSVATAVLGAAVAAAPAGAAVPLGGGSAGVQQVLFRSGAAGYGCFRIPALVRTAAGSLLAFAEGRKSPSCGDRGDIDLVVRRSTNDGRTWGPIRVVLAGSGSDPDAPYTRGNPAPVVDHTTGRVLLLTTSNPATPGGKRLPWIQHSDDDGVGWSPARPLGASFSGTDAGWFATGPSHGIQLTRGAHAGRLVVGAHQIPAAGTVNAGVLYSDDHGETWLASRAANSYREGVTNPGEVSVAELPDGSVYAAARNQIGDAANHRTRAVSTDGGASMPALTVVPSLVTPDVQGAVLTLRSTYQSVPGDTMIFSGPSHTEQRRQLKIRYSTDRGATWKSPAGGLLATDRSGYSDLAELAGGEIGVLYEGGAETDETGNTGSSADEIRFARLTKAALGLPGTTTGPVSGQPSPAAGPTTPDATAAANDAFLHGATITAGGRFGQGLSTAGAYADVPWSRTLDPGAGDFTVTLWFRYEATGTSPDQALFWAYGLGAGVAQVWLRARPGADQLQAWVDGTTTADVTLADPSPARAFGDGAWHHLALVRSGDRVVLSVDGTVAAERTGLTGPVSTGTTGIRLGARGGTTPAEHFTGTLDEFRLHRQALGAEELQRLRDTNTGTAGPALWLPFQVADTATALARTRVTISDDLSGHCASGTVLGGAPQLVAGRSGKALAVDADHRGVEVPFLPALDVGSGDFTFTTWFRHTAGTGSPSRVLLWAYGRDDERQLWVRAQPGEDRLRAWVRDDTGRQVSLDLPDPSSAVAFGGGAWHLLTLSRAGQEIRLSVDGGAPVTAGGVTGSLTADPRADIRGLRLGSRIDDGADVLTGALDNFRLYHRALSDAERAAIVAGRYPSDLPAVWWAFESGGTRAHSVVRPAPVSGPATPDSSVHCQHAAVRGGASRAGDGRFGSALALDGVNDTVQLAHGPATALGAADFTISTWVRHSAGGVLLWAYGAGAANRQLWLRAQPAQDQLLALFQTETATTMLAAPDASAAAAFGDGRWHHVALRRSAGTLTLAVDGVTLATAPVTGSLTYGDTFAVSGFQLGAKPDGTDALGGALDEFRIFRRALTDAELDRVRLDNADLGTVTAVRLPFETVTATGHARM